MVWTMGKAVTQVTMMIFFAFAWEGVLCDNTSKRSHLDNLVKIAKSEQLLQEMSDFLEENSFSKTTSSIIDKFGNLNINIVGTYMKVIEIGEVYEKFLKGEDDATKELIDAIGTLILFDIPGVVSPAVEVFGEIIQDIGDVPDDDPRKPIQKGLKLMNDKARWQAKSARGSVKGRIEKMQMGMHKMRNYVGKAIDDSVTRLPSETANKLKDAGKAANAFTVGGGEKFGKLLTKSGGTMNVLSMLYATYKMHEAAKEGDIDSVLEQGLVLAGSFVSLAASFAGAGSVAGPIGVVAGVALAGIAAIYGIIKPDPKKELEEAMKSANEISKKSLLNLYRDFEKLPDLTKSFSNTGSRRYMNNWFFECNQYFLKKTVKGIKPNTALSFKYTGSHMSLAGVSECMRWGKWERIGKYDYKPIRSSKCLRTGTKRKVDKSTYTGDLYELKGEENFQSPYDFYGYYNETSYGGSMIFLRTNLVPNDQLRSIDIDTKPPTWVPGGVQTGDDVLVLHDLSNLASDATVSINLRGGNDGVAINGMIGKFSNKRDDIVDIRFGDDSGTDYGGMVSFSGMSGDEDTFEKIKDQIMGVEYYASVDGGRGKVCFHWGKYGGSQKKGVTCPIKVSDIAIFGSSPLDDIIHLNSEHNMFVINEEGHNTYKFHITREDRRRTFQIVDKTAEPAIFDITSPFDVKIVYKERERSYELYILDEKRPNRPSGLYIFKTKIVYKGSKNSPVIKLPTGNVDQSDMLRAMSETNEGRSTQGLYAISTYAYLANAEPKNDDTPSAVCLCKPRDNYPEGYWTISMSSHVDALVVSNKLKENMQNAVSVKLIYDKVFKNDQTQGYDYGWFLQIREKDDLVDAGSKRADVRLKNADVVWTDDGKVLADLNDPYSLTNEIDLKSKEKTTYLFEEIENKEHDIDDTVILNKRINSGTGQTFSLGGGANTVVYDTTKNLNFDYKITAVSVGVDEDGKKIEDLKIKFYDRSKTVVFEDVDRVICQFEGGVQRDLQQFIDEVPTGKRTLQDDCKKDSPFKRRGKFHGKRHAAVSTGMCNSRCI